ncbi:MAG TPA: PA2779 family protein [Methylomirabilota bacterium]|nr:PA2779 family protein [Methylomirabilota bacterium]
MPRRTILAPRLVAPVLAWAIVLGLLPHVVEGAPIPFGGRSPAEPEVAGLALRLATAHLVALGVSPDEAAARLAALSDEERQALAARLDELGSGGSAAPSVLAIAIILGLLVVLILELLGRRVISRP